MDGRKPLSTRYRRRAISHFVSYRQGADDFLLIDYGHGAFNLNYRCRAVELYRKLKELKGGISFEKGTLHTGMACGNSLMLYYDSYIVGREKMLETLLKLENELGDLSEAKFASRKYKLPIVFNHKKQKESLQRYQETQRPYAVYLPDPFDFVAKNNAFTPEKMREILLEPQMVVAVGFFVALPIALPIDPQAYAMSEDESVSSPHTRRTSWMGWLLHGTVQRGVTWWIHESRVEHSWRRHTRIQEKL